MRLQEVGTPVDIRSVMTARDELNHVRLSFRPDVEGLRAVAVLLVVIFHAGFAKVSGGYIGVDVFLVSSGYLITGLLVNEHSVTGSIRLAEFYARRVRRLLPASTLMLAATCIASCLLMSPLERSAVARSAMAVSAYASNIYFAITARDYFAPEMASNPLLHTWWIAIEEQFYFVWP
jgi:peptidoglycan/LPS O-acetylase OafA/YrhL